MKPHAQIALIAALALGTTVLHYTTDPHAGAVHDIYQRFYYVPVILAGLWFGVKGGLLTAFVIAIVYFPHVYHGWHGPHSLFYRLMEVGMYHVIGALTGYLSAQARRALREREGAYQRLRQQTEELFDLEEQLRRADRLAALGKLSAGLAHEIRNPLASIKTSLEMLQERARAEAEQPEGSDDAPDFHAVLLEETERLNQILDNFLEFARLKEGEEGAGATAHVGEAAVKTAELVAGRAAKKGAALDIDEAGLDVMARIGEPLLRQIFLNLFLNALDAVSKPDGGIRVGLVASDADFIRVFVEDTGAGVPPGITARIFDPFFSTKDDGTGLGLAIVARILNGCGGDIRLDSGYSGGARFILSLPAVR